MSEASKAHSCGVPVWRTDAECRIEKEILLYEIKESGAAFSAPKPCHIVKEYFENPRVYSMTTYFGYNQLTFNNLHG